MPEGLMTDCKACEPQHASSTLCSMHAPHNKLCILQIVDETIPALQKLKQEGLVKFIGITGYPLDIYTYVLDR